MITCNNCGAKNNLGSTFCFNCGSPLSFVPQNAPLQAQANGAANTQYAPTTTVKGCFASAWEDVRSSQGWVGKSFLLALICLVPILNFVVAGYAMRWGRKAAFGTREGLPKRIFDDNSFATGFYWFILSLVVYIVAMITCFVLSLVPIVGILAAFVLLFFAYMFLCACGIRVALSGRLGSGFDFSAVFPAFKRSLGSLFCASVLPNLIIGLIVSVIETIIFTILIVCLGVSLAPFFSSSYYYSTQAVLSAIAPSLAIIVVVSLVLLYFSLVAACVAELITWRAMGYWAARNANEWLTDPSVVSPVSAVSTNGYAYSSQGTYAPPTPTSAAPTSFAIPQDTQGN